MGTNGVEHILASEIRDLSSLRNASPKGMPTGKEMKRLEIVVEAAEQASSSRTLGRGEWTWPNRGTGFLHPGGLRADRGIAGAKKRHCVAPLRDTLEAQSDKEVTDHIGR